MFRSLHMKLMLIMTLLIISLMTVVGAFLINSVANYYTQDFYTQMSEAFGDPDFWKDLETPIEGEEDAASSIAHILDTNSTLGIDNRSRKYYVLDGTDGHWLAGSDDKESGQAMPNDSRNLMRVLAGEDASDDNSPAAAYMDVAVAVQRGEGRYIVYVQDNGANVSALNSELITLIVEALIFGLIISVLLSFLLSKTLITPIERLTEGAERVADGDFSHKIEVASRDEIGVLTGTFNDMAQQLKRTLEEVENERTKLGTLFLHMTDGVVAFSRDGSVIPPPRRCWADPFPLAAARTTIHSSPTLLPSRGCWPWSSPATWTVSGMWAAAAWSFCSLPLTRSVWAAFLSSFTT